MLNALTYWSFGKIVGLRIVRLYCTAQACHFPLQCFCTRDPHQCLPALAIKVEATTAPRSSHGLLCKYELEAETTLLWANGGGKESRIFIGAKCTCEVVHPANIYVRTKATELLKMQTHDSMLAHNFDSFTILTRR